MPLINWINLNDNKDITQLSRTGKVCRYVNSAYERIEDSFIDTFGAGSDFMYTRSREIEIELMLNKQIQTGDYSTQLFIDLIQDEIDKKNAKKTEGKKLITLIPWVEFEMGIAIDAKKITVFEFYNKVNFILEKNK